MKSSTLLRRARRIIRDEGNEFICVALENAVRQKPQHAEKSEAIQKWIQEELLSSRYYSYEAWLKENGYPEVHRGLHQEKLKISRLAWLEWMINFWERKGD